MNLALKLKIFFFIVMLGKMNLVINITNRKKSDVQKIKREMVRYKGLPEASKIPGKYQWLASSLF